MTIESGPRRAAPMVLLALILAATVPAPGAQRLEETRAVEAGSAEGEETSLVISASEWIPGGARVAWSPKGDSLAFDKAGADGKYDLYLYDVVDGYERCLTCQMAEIKKTNNLNPAWHPGGEYLVFQSQRNPKRLDLDKFELTTPERSLHSDLYLVRVDGKGFWRLTRTEETGSAVLDAHFSYDGSDLVWSERTGTKDGRYGSWRVRVARLQFARGNPRLSRPRSWQGERRGLVVVQEFTPDDRSLLLSANLEQGQGELGSDLYRLDLETESLERLTHSRAQADEFAHITPRGEHIVWTSNSGLFPRDPPRVLEPRYLRDLWIMRRDGSEKRRLTSFNEPAARGSLAEAYVGDFAFSPNGDVVAVHVITPRAGEPHEAIWKILLEPSFRR